MTKKRQRLHREYDERSRKTEGYTVRGKYSQEYAKQFHDRALASLDLADDYLSTAGIEEAVDYLRSGKRDIQRAINIYTKLNISSPANEKCHNLEKIFSDHIENILSSHPELGIKDDDLDLIEIDEVDEIDELDDKIYEEDAYATDSSDSTLISSRMPMFRKKSNSRPQSTVEELENPEIIGFKK